MPRTVGAQSVNAHTQLVRMLTIEAVSLASARGFHDALVGFHVELEQSDATYTVRVKVGSDRDIIRVLKALETHLLDRGAMTTVG